MRVNRGAALGIALLAVASTGCRLDATLTIRLGTDGSGTVRIEAIADEELVERAARFGGGDPFADVRTGDLEAAGWQVTRNPATRSIVIERAFRTTDELAALIAGLEPDVETPVLQSFTAERDAGLFVDRFRVRGAVDLGQGGMSERLSTLLGGADPETVARVAGADPERAFHLTVSVVMPGDVGATTASQATLGVLTWPVLPGERREIDAESRRWNVLAVVTAAGSAVLVVIVVILSVAVARAAPRRRR